MGTLLRTAQAVVNAAWGMGHAQRSAPVPSASGPYHPRDPALAELFGLSSGTEAGVSVTPETAMQCPPVYACVRLLQNTVATIPLDLFERTGPDTNVRATGHPLHELVHDQPNDWQTAAEFRALLQEHVSTFGNGYGRIIPRGDGMVSAIEPMHPREVWPFRPTGGGVAYRWTPPDGPTRTLLPAEVLHLRCTPFRRDMIRGRSPVEEHRATIGAAMACIAYMARLFANNASPKGALKVPEALDDDAATLLRESWERRHKGLENAHKLAILDGGMEYLPIGMTSVELELIAQYKALVAQIASVWGIPLHMIGETEKSTSWGTGIEQQSIGFITYSVRPWLVYWEQALNRSLLSSTTRRRFYFEHNADGLLRGDFKTRMDGLGLSIQWGLMTPNEARRLLNLPPVDGGDVRLHPLNMVPADKVLDILLKAAPDAAKRALELANNPKGNPDP